MNSRVGALIAVLFGAGVMAAPWFLGGNLPPVRTIALGLVFLCSLACVLVPSLIGTPTRLGMMLRLVLVAGVAYAAFQLVPIFGGEAITASPSATRSRICELMLGIGAFLVASCLFRDQRVLPWFLGMVAFNGVLITFFGLAQTVSNTDKMFWFYELIQGGQPFGPFVNGNNAGGYLLLCFAAANFFLAQRIFRSQHVNKTNSHGPGNQSVISVFFNSIGRSFAKLDTEHLYILASVAAVAAGVLASISRGAAVGLFVSIFVGWSLLFRRSLAFAMASVVVAAVGVGVLVYTQQDEAIVSSLETLANVESLENSSRNRIAHWKDSYQYAMASQPLGSGLGTYSVMYPPYQKDWHFKRWFKHAENQYLETFAELGILGLLALLFAIGIVVFGCISLLNKPDSTSRAVGLTGLIAIVGQIIAGSFDYGLYQPANTLLMASLVGIVFSQLNWAWSAQHVAEENPGKGKARLAWAMMLGTALVTGWATYEYSAVDARRSVRRFNERFEPGRDREQVEKYQQLAEYAVQTRPDDPDAHYHLALNYILQYRLAASDEMLEQMNQTRKKLETGAGQGVNSSESTDSEQPETVSAVLTKQVFVRTDRDGGLITAAEPAFDEQEEIERPGYEAIEIPEFESELDSEFESEFVDDPQLQNPSLVMPSQRFANEPTAVDPSQQPPLRTARRPQEDNQFGGSFVPQSTRPSQNVQDSQPSLQFESNPAGSVGQSDRGNPESNQVETKVQADAPTQDRSEQLLELLPEEFTFDQAWERSTLMSLHRLAWASKREGGQYLSELQDSEPVQTYLTKAWEHLLLAEQHSGRYWLTPWRLANLALLMNQGEQEEVYLENAINRCPNNSNLLFLVGLTKHYAGKKDPAYDHWHQCLMLSREHDETILQIGRNEVGIKAFFEQILPSEPYFRIRIAKRYFGSDDDFLIRKLLLMHSKSKVGEHDLSDAERNFVLGEMERLSNNFAVSIAYFKKAIERENHRSDWRIQYARSLIAADMYDKAITELKVCELYHGNHHLVCQRLIRLAKRLRMEKFRNINDLEYGRN